MFIFLPHAFVSKNKGTFMKQNFHFFQDLFLFLSNFTPICKPNSTLVGWSRSWLCFPTGGRRKKKVRTQLKSGWGRSCRDSASYHRTGLIKLGKVQSSQHRSNICWKCQVKLGQVKSSCNRSSQDNFSGFWTMFFMYFLFPLILLLKN